MHRRRSSRTRWIGLGLGGLLVVAGLGWLVWRGVQAYRVRRVLELMLTSWQRWQSLAGEAVVLFTDEQGQTQGFRERFILQRPYQARFEVLDYQGTAVQMVWMTDGERVYVLQPATRAYQEGRLPRLADREAALPRAWGQVAEGQTYRHPLQAQIPSPVAEFLFPLPFVRREPGRTYALEGTARLLGRDVWVLTAREPDRALERFWVDQATGVVLRYVRWEHDKPVIRFDVVQFEVDTPWDKTFFQPKQGKTLE